VRVLNTGAPRERTSRTATALAASRGPQRRLGEPCYVPAVTALAPAGFCEPPWTFERAAQLDPDETPGEIVNGEFVPVSRGTWRHGAIVASIVFLFKLYARENPGWSVATSDPGTKLKRNPDTLRGPDVGIVRQERKPKGKGVEGWLEGAPDVVVEVAGDAQTTTSLLQKASEYLRAGAQQVWIVDPDAERLLVMTPPDRIRILGPTDILEGGTALPGFRCEVAELFRT
jgi:Uma2 family endonuclease